MTNRRVTHLILQHQKKLKPAKEKWKIAKEKWKIAKERWNIANTIERVCALLRVS
jgi:hypothetical protein